MRIASRRGHWHAKGAVGSQSAIPNPQSPIHREAFRLPACKSGVAKPAGSDDWSVTSASHQCHCRLSIANRRFRPRALSRAEEIGNQQSAIGNSSNLPRTWFQGCQRPDPTEPSPRRPPIAGANSAWCSSNILRSGRRERECKSPRAVQLSRSVAQSSERPAWDREAAGGNPAVPTSVELRVVRCELSPETARPVPLPNSSHLHPLSTRLAAVAEERGIRLLSEPMQVQLLPAAPTPAAQSDNSSPPAC